MYSSGVKTSHNDSGVSLVLIPHIFVWPYGGRSVYLIGSFTRWSDRLPMTLVEGHPTVFQTVCSLAPGYHEYKFYVDGEWRHDESRPCVCGKYGIVNTIILEGQPDYIQIASPLIPSASCMDVDNTEGFQHPIMVSDRTYQYPLPGLPQNDVQISRHRVLEYMSSHTAYDVLPESGKVIALDMDLPVKQAFHILYEQGCAHAPIWDAYKGQFIGVLSPLDFILMLRELGRHRSNMSQEELEIHTISAWKVGKPNLDRQIRRRRRDTSRGLIQAGPNHTLKDLALQFLQNEVSTVPIMYSSSEDASFPQILHLASLSEILKCICRYFQNLDMLPILQLPICTLHLGTWAPAVGETNGVPLAILRPNDSLSTALSLLLQVQNLGHLYSRIMKPGCECFANSLPSDICMQMTEAQVSSIPIVDDNGSLLSVYSRSDITVLAKGSAYAHINIDEFTIGQALQFGNDVYNGKEFSRCQVCLRNDPLLKVMELLAKPGVRRLVIVEQSSGRVEGIISLRDIFKFLLG